MVRRVYLDSVREGMILGHTIYGNEGEELLKAGVNLNHASIRKLSEIGHEYIYIDDGLTADYIVKDVVSRKTRTAASQQVKNILVETKESGRLVIEPSSIYRTVNDITSELFGSKSLMINLVDIKTLDDYTFTHSVNVCVLALMTGITMGLSHEELAILGVGALLHDVGKVKIPDSILNKPGALAPEEFSEIKKHTTYGYELIINNGGLNEFHALIAQQHHENYDGSGYPHGIKGDQFHVFAQIISIADRFDALTADRVYRKALPPFEAYEMCAASGNYYFRFDIVKAFLSNIAAYPSGSLVQLNNNKLAVVLDTPRGKSLFPRVRILFDHKNKPLSTPQLVSLAEEKNLFVVRMLDDRETLSLLQHYR